MSPLKKIFSNQEHWRPDYSLASRPGLVSIQRGNLNPTLFAYDDYGFLNQVRQGEYVDDLKIQHQSAAQRKAEILAKNARKPYGAPVNGRILSDVNYKYSYPGNRTKQPDQMISTKII